MSEPLMQFRGLLVASFLLAVAGGIVDLVFPQLLPEFLADADRKLAEVQGDSWGLTGALLMVAGGLPLAAAAIVSYIGLFLLKRWARGVAVLTTALALLLYIPLGAAVHSGLSLMLTETSMMAWGAVLAMAYFSPLGPHFDAPG